MPRKKIVDKPKLTLDDRFSLDSYDGIIGSLRVVAEGIANETLKKDKADLLLKVLGSARMTITEKRKSSVLSLAIVTSLVIAPSSIPVTLRCSF